MPHPPRFSAGGLLRRERPSLLVRMFTHHRLQLPHKLFMPTGLHRCYGAGYLHFITTSCYRRLPLLAKPENRDLFLEVLEQARRRYHFVVVGYVVMPEHVHLLLSEPERGNLSLVMQALKQGFARRLLCGLRHRHDPRQEELWGARARATAHLAAALLRFCGLERGETPREATLRFTKTRCGADWCSKRSTGPGAAPAITCAKQPGQSS